MRRLRASALLYAVTVALLLGSISGAVLLLVHFGNVESERWLAGEAALANARSAIHAYASGGDGPVLDEWNDLFGKGHDSVFVTVERVGMLDRVKAIGRKGDQETSIEAFLWPVPAGGPVLMLGRDAGALHMCGDARLRGDISIPNGDVRRGHIEGRGFSGEPLVEGKVAVERNDHIGDIDADRYARIRDNCSRTPQADEFAYRMGEVPDPQEEASPGTPVLSLHGKRTLTGMVLQGPLVLRCDDSLHLGADCRFDMVVVQAPFISIAPGARLVVQCFADRGILVGRDVRLEYPSALVLLAGNDASPPALTIDSMACVEGLVLAARRAGTTGPPPVVLTAPGSLVRGEVHAAGRLQHQGVLRGRAAAEELVLRTPSAIYKGHLLDGVIGPYDGGRASGSGGASENLQEIARWSIPGHRTKGA